MKLEFSSLEEACDFAYEVRFKAMLQAQHTVDKADKPTTEKRAEPKAAAEVVEDKVTKEEEPAKEETTYNIKEVRAKLTELSRAGKAKEVKKILTEAGAANVSSLCEDKYAEVMEKAGEL